jgi:two-component system cell cycle response regulator
VKNSTILIVDDEKINIDFIVNNLNKLYNIKVASNGKIALEILDRFDIDMILLDIEMPILDGYETAKKIISNPHFREIPFIFLTAKTDSKSIAKGFEIGAKDYVTKPFNTKELQARVQNHLKTYHLIKKIESLYKNLEKFIDTQNNIVILTSGKELIFANKKFYSFFGYKNLEDFHKYHKCICDFFVKNDRFFHLGKIDKSEEWVDEISTLPEPKRVVSMVNKEFISHAFSVCVNQYDENTKIVSFYDISEDMIEQSA